MIGTKFNLDEKFSLFAEQWQPKVAAELNGQAVKLVKIEGAFPWHHHQDEDELFLVWQGEITLEFCDRSVTLTRGEGLVVPKGVEHRPVADREAQILLFEPTGVRNTGNIDDPNFTAPPRVVI